MINPKTNKKIKGLEPKIKLIKYIKNCIDNNEREKIRIKYIADYLFIDDSFARTKIQVLVDIGWIQHSNYVDMEVLIDIDELERNTI